QAEDGIRDFHVTGVQTCALPISDELIHDLIAKATYNNHALGFSILGRQDVLQQLTADDLYAFMQAHYTSTNTVIAVAGHIREDQIGRASCREGRRFTVDGAGARG